MNTRREFFEDAAGTMAGIAFVGCGLDYILGTPGFSDAERVAMLGETAAKLLGIKA